MLKMKRFLRVKPDDKASAIFSGSVIFIICLLTAMAVFFNLNLQSTAKGEFNEIAQRSAQASVQAIDSSGSLGNAAVKRFVDTYRTQMNDSSVLTSNFCNTAVIDGVERRLPYMVIKLNNGRELGNTGSQTWRVEGNDAPQNLPLNLPAGKKYKAINVEVYTKSRTMFNVGGVMPVCSPHHTAVSAVAFGSNRDLSRS